jgi:glutamate N-acetyltransferase / amino-acid N-acetyltransferase
LTPGFFASRWVPCPDHVAELGGAGLPAGFRAAGVAAGIKPSGSPDVGVLVCDAAQATSAARFTASGTQAPPVLLCR